MLPRDFRLPRGEMIFFTHKSFASNFKIDYEMQRIGSGGYNVIRRTLYSEDHQILDSESSQAFNLLLHQLPVSSGTNDIEDSLYDGDLLTVTLEDAKDIVIALSLPSRKSAVQWWNQVEGLIAKE